MKPQFIIYSLPRSRSFWLSRFLAYGDWGCGHDEIRHLRTLEDIKAWFSQPMMGTVETGAASWWRLVQDICPDIRTLVIRRPVNEVVESLLSLNIPFDRNKLRVAMERMDAKLDQIERRIPGVMSVNFTDLQSEDVCATIFEHCLPYQHDKEWWNIMSPLNLQVNLSIILRYCQANHDQLDKLAKMAKQRVLAGMNKAQTEIEDITIQQESFDTFFRDASKLFDDHLVQVGEAPGSHLKKNIPLMRLLDDLGAMQVTTARSNGRMFGYLMAVMSQSLESPDVMSAVHLTFYASKDVPGLGMKLQKASIAALREKGINELFLRAGPRGSGPKMGALYRRLGAVDAGHLYELKLEAA